MQPTQRQHICSKLASVCWHKPSYFTTWQQWHPDFEKLFVDCEEIITRGIFVQRFYLVEEI